MPDTQRTEFQAVIAAPFGRLGLRCSASTVIGIEFLPSQIPLQTPTGALARRCAEQLECWFTDPDFHFTLPLALTGTAHQNRVWQALQAIPRGKLRSYGDIAAEIGSAPRAVGQACGSNPLPIIVPCHRVVGKAGLGGFMHRGDDGALNIKRWLLEHERWAPITPTRPEPSHE
jgi:methylated-DNA-[protein]-cysteine S-methyltransferase